MSVRSHSEMKRCSLRAENFIYNGLLDYINRLVKLSQKLFINMLVFESISLTQIEKQNTLWVDVLIFYIAAVKGL